MKKLIKYALTAIALEIAVILAIVYWLTAFPKPSPTKDFCPINEIPTYSQFLAKGVN